MSIERKVRYEKTDDEHDVDRSQAGEYANTDFSDQIVVKPAMDGINEKARYFGIHNT